MLNQQFFNPFSTEHCHGNKRSIIMAVFFNCGLQGHLKRTNSSPHLLEWHPSRPLLAVASKDEAAEADGTVHIHSDKVRVSLRTSGTTS